MDAADMKDARFGNVMVKGVLVWLLGVGKGPLLSLRFHIPLSHLQYCA